MRYRLIILIFFVASSPYLMAQDIASATLRWTCDQTTNLRDGSSSTYACAFVTLGTTRVSWLQRNGQVVTDYAITGTESSWPDVSQEGQFVYLLTREGKPGRMVVKRTAAGVTITLDFSESGPHHIKQQFRVSEVAPQP